MASSIWIAQLSLSGTCQTFFLPGKGWRGFGVGTDEAPEIDDNGMNVGHLPYDVPVAPRFQHRVKRVDVFLREHLGRQSFRALPREDGDVGDMDSGDRVDG